MLECNQLNFRWISETLFWISIPSKINIKYRGLFICSLWSFQLCSYLCVRLRTNRRHNLILEVDIWPSRLFGITTDHIWVPGSSLCCSSFRWQGPREAAVDGSSTFVPSTYVGNAAVQVPSFGPAGPGWYKHLGVNQWMWDFSWSFFFLLSFPSPLLCHSAFQINVHLIFFTSYFFKKSFS